MFLKTSTQQAYNKLLTGRSSLARLIKPALVMSTAQAPLMASQMPAMGFLTANKRDMRHVMGTTQRRAFSLPDHLVMEMPNLSPTMEKVSQSTRGTQVT